MKPYILLFCILSYALLANSTCNNCPANDRCCEDLTLGPVCYNPETHSCVRDQVLCGIDDGACGTICYDKRTHLCCSNQLYGKDLGCPDANPNVCGASTCGADQLCCNDEQQGSVCYSIHTHKCPSGNTLCAINDFQCGNLCTNAEEFITRVIRRMTLKQKIGQMTQIDITMFMANNVLNETLMRQALVEFQVGSLFNSPYPGGPTETDVGFNAEQFRRMITNFQLEALQISDIQEYDPFEQLRSTDNTQNEPILIPIIFALDAVHGANYIINATYFPQNIALAATWNSTLAELSARVTAKDLKAAGVTWNFAPVCDLGVKPEWGRHWETFGEDPYLTSLMCSAAIRGFQGGFSHSNLSLPISVAATAKHYLGYGDPRSGHDRSPAWIPERFLIDYHLPPFQHAVKSGVSTIMLNSGEVNGEPLHASKRWVDYVLRERMGFDGVIVTDWQDIGKLMYMHRITPSFVEATRLAVEAGIDISMVPVDFSFAEIMLELVQKGVISESRVDESVRRILRLKYELGLFHNPVPTVPHSVLSSVGSQSDRTLALDAARESITLLKNSQRGNWATTQMGVLPLPKNLNKILVAGPTANSLRAQNGGWTLHWQGATSESEFTFGTTILSGIRSVISGMQGDTVVTFWNGANFTENADLTEVSNLAQDVDAVIVALGEAPYAEFLGDIRDLTLPASQLQLVHTLAKSGKPIIGVLVEGRPRIIGEIINELDGLVDAYLPGSEGGLAVAEVLFGVVNPSGKLPFTYPNYTADAGTPYYHKFSDVIFGGISQLFPFGHGLSYTNFTYSNIEINPKNISNKFEKFNVSATVTNSGSREGKEVVMLYISDMFRKITPEMKMLERFRKVSLLPGESMKVDFSLSTVDLSFVDGFSGPHHDDMGILGHSIMAEEGQFSAQIGDQKVEFWLTESHVYDLDDRVDSITSAPF